MCHTNVVVEFLNASHEERRRILAVQQDRGTVGAFNRDGTPGAGNGSGDGLHRDVDLGRVVRGDRHGAGLRPEAVVVDVDLVVAGCEGNVVTLWPNTTGSPSA